jgi:hypothetical protein
MFDITAWRAEQSQWVGADRELVHEQATRSGKSREAIGGGGISVPPARAAGVNHVDR